MTGHKISFYYQKLNRAVNSDDDLQGLIDLHSKTFERFGWEIVQADESVSRQHRLYDFFNDPDIILNKPYNEYHRSCYMRWLAYAVLGHPFADFDVINYGFTPQDADDVRALNISGQPIMMSGAGAMGLLEGSDYDKLLKTYTDFVENPKIEGPIAEIISDMTIMRHYHVDWYNCLPHQDERIVKDYTRDGWDKAKLVHYAHGLTDIPRVQTILKARPPLD